MPKKTTITNLNKSKLVKLLAKLEPKTVKAFKAWYKQLGHPERDAFLILDYLLSYFPAFDSLKLQQDIAFKKIFKKTSYDYRKLMKGVSQVHLDLKQYLVYQELVNDPFLNDFLLAQVYSKYDLQHELSLLLTKKRANALTNGIPTYFYEQMQWENLNFQTDATIKLDQKENSLNIATTHLDNFYLGLKLKAACEIATKQVLLKATSTLLFEQSIQKYCKANYDQLPIFHQFYWLTWQLILNRSDTEYDQLKKLFFQQSDKLHDQDQLILFTYLVNHSIYVSNNRGPNLQEIFKLYQFGIDQNILSQNAQFATTHFSNLISVSCALGAFDWLENALNRNLKDSLSNLNASELHLGYARLAMGQKDYLKCKGHLVNVDFSSFTYSLRARSLSLICNLELHTPSHITETNCKSFENYLRRNREKNPNKCENYLHFISFIRQLAKIHPNKQQLAHEIINAKVALKPWLFNKIQSLKN